MIAQAEPKLIRVLTVTEALRLSQAFQANMAANAQLRQVWAGLGLDGHDLNKNYQITDEGLMEVGSNDD